MVLADIPISGEQCLARGTVVVDVSERHRGIPVKLTRAMGPLWHGYRS